MAGSASSWARNDPGPTSERRLRDAAPVAACDPLRRLERSAWWPRASHAIADFRASDYPTPMKISFGPDWQKDLWASPFRLRFGLNDEDVDPEAPPATYVNMFTMSYDRARVLARAALPGCSVTAVVAANPKPRSGGNGKWRDWTRASAFSQLKDIGVATKPARSKWSGQLYPAYQDGGDLPPWKHRTVDLTWDQADILLWSNIAQDLGVRPVAPVLAKLVDIERGVSVCAYDDRGMDISALDPKSIVHLCKEFDRWLLDYDRPRMALAFPAAS